MVRILKVRDVAERKRQLLRESELYRQTLRVEAASVKFSLDEWHRKWASAKSAFLLAGAVAPLAGFFFGRRRGESGEKNGQARAGWLDRLKTGMRVAGWLWPLLRKFGRGEPEPAGGEGEGAVAQGRSGDE